MKSFRLATHVRLGHDAINALAEFASCRVLLVTDEFLSTTDIFAQVKSHLGEQATVFTGVTPNPTISQIAKGLAVYFDAHPDVVIAYGGGSVMDAAKAMHKAALDSGRGASGGIVAIPTTSGSGSEVTSFAVVTDEASHTKLPMVSPDMVARLAILDPAVVVGVPPHVTADSGMDVLTHAIEAYVSRDACDFSDALVEKAVSLVFEHLPRCYIAGEDLSARSHMHNASCMAAMAFDNAGLGITHSLAHALGGHYPIAHGRLNAMLLRPVIAFHADRSEWAASRYARLGRVVSPEAQGRAAVMTLLTAIEKLNRRLGIPGRLSDLGVSSADLSRDLPDLVQAALADGCTKTNPVNPSSDDLAAIIREIA